LDRNAPAPPPGHRNAALPAKNGVQADPPRWQASYPVHAGVATSAEIEDMIECTTFAGANCELARLILDAMERMLSPLLSPFKRG
jgi:hypothetical protein